MTAKHHFTIFDHSTLSELLCAYAKHRKAERRSWTLKRWATELELAGPSMLSMCLGGSRVPGEKLVNALCRQLTKSPREAEYVRDLAALARAKTVRGRRQIMRRLVSHRSAPPVALVGREKFLAVSRWQYYAIREMVSLKSFREDAEWIARRLEFSLTPIGVKDAIRTLLAVNLLGRDETGRLVPTCGHIDTSHDIADEGIKRYHEQSLENARLSVRRHDPTIREFYGTTFVLKRERVSEAKELIRDFHRQFCKLLEEDRGDDVYQLEIGFFPVARGEV